MLKQAVARLEGQGVAGAWWRCVPNAFHVRRQLEVKRRGDVQGAVQRLRPKLVTVCAVLASLIPIL